MQFLDLICISFKISVIFTLIKNLQRLIFFVYLVFFIYF